VRKNLHRQQSGFAAEYDSLYRMAEELPLRGVPPGGRGGRPPRGEKKQKSPAI